MRLNDSVAMADTPEIEWIFRAITAGPPVQGSDA